MPGSAVIPVAYFGVLPGHPAPLLRRPGQAVFLLPTPEFGKNAAAGGSPPPPPLHGLDTIAVDGGTSPADLAGRVAARFGVERGDGARPSMSRDG